MIEKIVLEKAAYTVAKENSVSPLIFQLPIDKGREILENVQNSYVYKYPAKIKSTTVTASHYGRIKVYTIIPENGKNIENMIFYIHGAGWVFGSFHTHEKLVRELAYRSNSVVIFPEYTRSPDVKFPIAIEQCYSILNQIPNILKFNNIFASTNSLIVAGDSVGGNMSIAMVFLSKLRKGPKIRKQLLYYPVTDDIFNTCSYSKFATNYYLYRDGMKWFWNNYFPEHNVNKNILATPLKATLGQLRNFPPTMIINSQADVLHDEGESFANKLRCAGNNVVQITFLGMIHDFVMLNSLDQTQSCRTAMTLSTAWLKNK